MNNNAQGKVNYRKMYRKSLLKYIAMMHMAELFDLLNDDKKILFAILDEPPLTDWDWYRIVDQDTRYKALFAGHCFYTFNDDYPKALCYAHEKIDIMSN